MKNNKLTDRIIRNKLKYHASANPDHLWEAIEAELPRDKNDQSGFWWFTGGMLGLALLLSAAAFLWMGENENVTSIATSNSEAIAIANESQNALQNVTQNEESETATNKPNKHEVTKVKVAAAVVAKSDIDSELDQTHLATSKKKNSTATNKKFANLNNNKFTNTNFTASTIGEKVAEDFFTIKQATYSNNKTATLQTGDAEVSPLSMSDKPEQLEILTTASRARHFASLNLSSKDMLPLSAKEKELDWPSLLKDPKCATFGKWLKLQFYLDAYVSPDIAFRKLKSKATDFERYAADRRATESQLLSFSSGIRFSVISNYGLSARTGIVYSQINEKFDYQEELTEVKTTSLYDSDGNLISSDTISQAGTHYITTYNRYRMVDVPLLLGYEFAFKKFSLSVNSGVYANLISRQKGDFLSPGLEPVTFSSEARDRYPAFRKRLNLSLYGSLAMYINLSERWQFMMEPQVRYFLDPMTKSSYEVEQKYITTGLITGLRYRF